MIELTLGEVARIVDGRLAGADSDTVVTGSVEFDSRAVTPGGLFLALLGDRVDGHDFAATATGAGAVATIASRSVDGPAILVEDGFTALAALAAHVVRALPDLTVVGITGSSGKTSTKDLVAQLLARRGPTVAPPGSFNNELGHPYTVLRADATTRFLVLENSARGIGHIRHLTRIAPPRLGAVLNVGHAHVGEFGSQEAIAVAKGELVEALPADGVAVLNRDDPLVWAMRARTAARVVAVGRAGDADVRAVDVELDDLGRARFALLARDERHEVALQLVGEHHVGNALSAAAIALECGLSAAEVAAGLSTARPASRYRMEVTDRADGVTVVNDAYNANPESTAAALQALAALGRRGRRTVAVLGPMAELGPETEAAHDAIGRLAAELGIAEVVAVGEPARPIQQAAALEGSSVGTAVWVPDTSAALRRLQATLSAGDVVLVKASQSARLTDLGEQLAADGGGGDA